MAMREAFKRASSATLLHEAFLVSNASLRARRGLGVLAERGGGRGASVAGQPTLFRVGSAFRS